MNSSTPISGSVGASGRNHPEDVKLIQMLLNNWLRKAQQHPLKVDGIVGPKTLKAIRDYQKTLGSVVDARIDPNGPTIGALVSLQVQILTQGVSKYIRGMARVASYRSPLSSSLSSEFDAALHKYFLAAKKL